MSVRKPTPFPEPRFSKAVFHLSRMIIRPYLYLAMGVRGITTIHREYLKEALSSPYPVILAFRHSAKEDAPVLLAAVKESHVRFLHGRDVLYWAGNATLFLFPRLGFIAVQNRSANKEGMQYLRKKLARPRKITDRDRKYGNVGDGKCRRGYHTPPFYRIQICKLRGGLGILIAKKVGTPKWSDR